MADTANITAPASLTKDLAAWLHDLDAWTRGHALLLCDCEDAGAHDDRHTALMLRKADLLDRCRAAEARL